MSISIDQPGLDPLREALELLSQGRDLHVDPTRRAVAEILAGRATPERIAAFLTALRCRGETAEELSGAVDAAKAAMDPAMDRPDAAWRQRPVLDTCGTGGDGARTVNISTAAAIVVAAVGQVVVAKHGNRSASGNSGSAEVLEQLGVAPIAEPEMLNRCLEELGIAFLYAPRFHAGFRHAGPVRKQLPFRTLFNLVGPLANPARPTHQLLGVASRDHARMVAEALSFRDELVAAVVVHGGDGLDEVTLDGPTWVFHVRLGTVVEQTWTPESFGLEPVTAAELVIATPTQSATRIREMLRGGDPPLRRIVLANVAAALWSVRIVEDLSEGVTLGREAIDDGRATELLERWSQLCPAEA